MNVFLQILTLILSTTSIGAIVTFFIYFKQNRQLKNNEVKLSDEDIESKSIQNEKEKISLGDMYIESIKNLQDTFQQNINSVNELTNTMQSFISRIEQNESSTSLIIRYLNGDFQNWLEKNNIK